MKIGLQAWGSDGDIRPLVALAAGLVRAGHQASLIATSVDDTDYAPLCQRLGVGFRAISTGVRDQLAVLAAQVHQSPVRLLQGLLNLAYRPFAQQMAEASAELCLGNDVVVGHFMQWQLRAHAVHLGRPHVGFLPWPGLVPSRLHAPPGVPNLGLLRWLGWRAVRWAIALGVGADIRASYTSVGARPPAALSDGLFSSELNLLGASPALWPPASDWGDRFQVCGYLAIPEAEEPWQPDPSLAAFLSEGAPPAFLSMGSSEQVAVERTRWLLAGAARASGQRCIIQLKSDRSEGSERADSLLFVKRVPHAALFPRCSLIVHHGGAGTAHTAARAGVPSLTLPFVAEQTDWGRRLARLGAGLAPLSFWKATPTSVATAMNRARADHDLRRTAKTAAATLAAEDGVTQAVRLIEQLQR